MIVDINEKRLALHSLWFAQVAKRGRIPGLTPSPRLRLVDLVGWRAG